MCPVLKRIVISLSEPTYSCFTSNCSKPSNLLPDSFSGWRGALKACRQLVISEGQL